MFILPYSRTVSESSVQVLPTDNVINVDLRSNMVTLYLPSIQEFVASASKISGSSIVTLSFNDIYENASKNPVKIVAREGETINGQQSVTFNTNGASGTFFVTSGNKWSIFEVSADAVSNNIFVSKVEVTASEYLASSVENKITFVPSLSDTEIIIPIRISAYVKSGSGTNTPFLFRYSKNNTALLGALGFNTVAPATGSLYLTPNSVNVL